MEWPGLKKTTIIIEFQPPCYVQGRQPPDQAAQSHIQPGLECLQGWGIHSLLGQPVPVRHHPLCEKLLPNIQPKPLLSQFKTIPPCPTTMREDVCIFSPFKTTLNYLRVLFVGHFSEKTQKFQFSPLAKHTVITAPQKAQKSSDIEHARHFVILK